MDAQRVVVLRHYEELVEMLVDLQGAADTSSSDVAPGTHRPASVP